MREIYLLSKAMLRGSDFGGFTMGKSKKAPLRIGGLGGLSQSKMVKGAGRVILILVIVAYVCGAFGTMGWQMGEQVANGAMPVGVGVGSLLMMPLILTLITSVTMTATLYYFSNDLPNYLVLPVQPSSIIAARFIVTYLMELLYAAVFFLPASVALGIRAGLGVSYYLKLLVAVLQIPLIPMSLVLLILMPVMRFFHFAKNRERMQMIINLSMMLGIIVMVVFIQKTNPAVQGTRVFHLGFLVNAFNPAQELYGWGILGLCVLAGLAVFFLTLVLANFIYIKGAMGQQTTTAKRKRLKEKEWATYGTSRAPWRALLKREHLKILRSPTFFVNYLVMGLVMPLLIVGLILFMVLSKGLSLDMLRTAIDHVTSAPELHDMAYGAAAFAATCFSLYMGGMSPLAVSSITREGKEGAFLLTYPVSLRQVVMVKLGYSLFWGLSIWIVMIVVLSILFRPPVDLTLLLLVIFLLGGLFSQLMGLAVDMLKPKLNWVNEAQVAQKNYNVLIDMVLTWGLAIFIALPLGFAVFSWHWSPAAVFSFALGGLVVLNLLASFVVHKSFARLRRQLADVE